VLEVVVEHVRWQDRLAFELLLELVAVDDLAVLLAGVKMQADLVEDQLPPTPHPALDLIRLADLQTIGDEGVDVEVQNRVGSDHDPSAVLEEASELRRHMSDVVDQQLEVDVAPGRARPERGHEFPAFSDKRHGLSLVCGCLLHPRDACVREQQTSTTARKAQKALVAMVKIRLNYSRIMLKSQAIHQENPTMHGFLLIDKPAGITSHDVVDRVRHITGERRVGHAGTLDPFATGLLIVGVGRPATREMQKLVGLDKKYEAVFVLGASSTTDDTEGVITDAPLTREFMIHDLTPFTGEIEQIPPTYSAIKVGGKKMYEAARAGKPLEARPRLVKIYSIETLPMSLRGSAATEAIFQRIASSCDKNLPPRNDMYRVSLRIHCSSGTYIRAIARDLGRALGGGGYVEQLRRTSIGPFSIGDASRLDTLDTLEPLPLISVETLLGRL
jgi:tRNA pseudouridine55 synthase